MTNVTGKFGVIPLHAMPVVTYTQRQTTKGAFDAVFYDLLLFAHISGALGFFSCLALWVTLLAALRHAQRVEDVRTLTTLILHSQGVAVISILVVLAAGLAMTVTTWSFTTGWIDVALGSMVLMAPLSPTFIEPRLRTIATLAATTPAGPIPVDLTRHIQSPLLGTALYVLIPVIFGLVAVMVFKPSFSLSLALMAGALSLGLMICLPLWITGRRQRQR